MCVGGARSGASEQAHTACPPRPDVNTGGIRAFALFMPPAPLFAPAASIPSCPWLTCCPPPPPRVYAATVPAYDSTS